LDFEKADFSLRGPVMTLIKHEVNFFLINK